MPDSHSRSRNLFRSWKRITGKEILIVSLVIITGASLIFISVYLFDEHSPIGKSLQVIGVSFFLAFLSSIVDRHVFTDHIYKSQEWLLQRLEIADVGIEKIYANGISDFWPEIYKKLGPEDTLTVLETFVDISTHGLVYKQLYDLDKNGVQISFICLRHHEDVRGQIEIRSEMSQEKNDYFVNHKFFWDKISILIEQGNSVSAREITFLPSVAIYQLDYKLRRKPTEIYFTPIVGGDSEITHYFKIHPGRLDLPLARKIIEYLRICEKFSVAFDPQEWGKEEWNYMNK